jgi:molecular chaperone HscB
MALSRAIEVNEAWRALRDPIKRAEALLVRLGVPVGETAEPKARPGAADGDDGGARGAVGRGARKNMEAVHNLALKMRAREGA